MVYCNLSLPDDAHWRCAWNICGPAHVPHARMPVDLRPPETLAGDYDTFRQILDLMRKDIFQSSRRIPAIYLVPWGNLRHFGLHDIFFLLRISWSLYRSQRYLLFRWQLSCAHTLCSTMLQCDMGDRKPLLAGETGTFQISTQKRDFRIVTTYMSLLMSSPQTHLRITVAQLFVWTIQINSAETHGWVLK